MTGYPGKFGRFKFVGLVGVILAALVLTPTAASAHVIHSRADVWASDPYCMWLAGELSHGKEWNNYGGYTRVSVYALKAIKIGPVELPCEPGTAGGVNEARGTLKTQETLYIWAYPGVWELCHLGAVHYNSGDSIDNSSMQHHTSWTPPCGEGWYLANIMGGAVILSHWRTRHIIPCENAGDGGSCFHWLPCKSGDCGG